MSTRTTAKAQDAGPLVVCCAKAEAASIRSALAEMVDLGHTLEIVEGVEEDARRLTPVIERLHGDGLYVLCRSKLLGRDTVEQLREILLTHHVPFGRTVTVATRRPRDLVDRIKASVARSGTRRSSTGNDAAAEPRAAAASPPAERIARPAPAAKPAPRTAIPPLSRATLVATPAALARARVTPARTPSATDVAFEEAITGPQKVVPRPAPASSPEPDDFDPPTVELPDLRQRALSEATDPELSAISLTDAAIEVYEDEVDEEDLREDFGEDLAEDVADDREAGTTERPVDPLHDPTHDIESSLAGVNLSSVDFSDLERAESGRIALQGLSVPVRTGNTSVAPVPMAPVRREPSIPGPPMPEPSASRGATASPSGPSGYTPRPTTLAVAAVPPDDRARAPERSGPPSTPPSTPSSTPSSLGPGPAAPPYASFAASSGEPLDLHDDDVAAPRTKLYLGIGLAAVAVVALAVAVAMGGDDEPSDEVAQSDGKTGGSTPDPSPSGDEASPPGSETAEDGGAAAEPEPDPEAERMVAVGAALEERKVRALDILLVQPSSVGPMTHGDAVAYCETLDLAGLAGWRLPEVGELYSLSSAGMVGTSVYWSRTAGDTFGDSHLAWHGRRKRVQHESGKSRVLCVNGERAAL